MTDFEFLLNVWKLELNPEDVVVAHFSEHTSNSAVNATCSNVAAALKNMYPGRTWLVFPSRRNSLSFRSLTLGPDRALLLNYGDHVSKERLLENVAYYQSVVKCPVLHSIKGHTDVMVLDEKRMNELGWFRKPLEEASPEVSIEE